MVDFYDLIDIYAGLHDIDKTEALHLWYRGAINAEDLLDAFLEDQGIFGYSSILISTIKTLAFQSKRDGKGDPWCLEVAE